jgi:hypothetical protein
MPQISDSKYPSPSDMPEMSAPPPGAGPGAGPGPGGGGGANPVIGAFQTLQTWISAQEQSGAPGIAEFKQKFIELLQTAAKIGGGGAGGAPPPGTPGQAPTPPPGAGAPKPMASPTNTVPMNAGGSPTAKPMI